jgi:hypothetical protein
VQDWLRTGVPPVQPAGDDADTVRVCVPFDWHAPHALYVNELQVVTGGVYVQACESAGVPEQLAGDEAVTVRVCVPVESQAPHAEYVYVHAGGT